MFYLQYSTDIGILFLHLAASVASQWLELLHQDIKGRLAGREKLS